MNLEKANLSSYTYASLAKELGDNSAPGKQLAFEKELRTTASLFSLCGVMTLLFGCGIVIGFGLYGHFDPSWYQHGLTAAAITSGGITAVGLVAFGALKGLQYHRENTLLTVERVQNLRKGGSQI